MEKQTLERIVEKICKLLDGYEVKLKNVYPKTLKQFPSVRKLNGYNIEKRTSYPLGNNVTIYFIQFSKPLSGELIYLALIAEDDVELSSYKAETLEDSKPFFKIFDYAYRDAKRVVEDFLNKEI